jgi:hypothetical protein
MSLEQISPFATERPAKDVRRRHPRGFLGASPEPARRGESIVAETSPYLPHFRLQRILPLQLQLAAFLRSVDYRGLKWHLSSFRINTSKNLCRFCISLNYRDLKSPTINTSMKNDFKFSRINTSTKTGGGGVQLQLELPLQTGRIPDRLDRRAYLGGEVRRRTAMAGWRRAMLIMVTTQLKTERRP